MQQKQVGQNLVFFVWFAVFVFQMYKTILLCRAKVFLFFFKERFFLVALLEQNNLLVCRNDCVHCASLRVLQSRVRPAPITMQVQRPVPCVA